MRRVNQVRAEANADAEAGMHMSLSDRVFAFVAASRAMRQRAAV